MRGRRKKKDELQLHQQVLKLHITFLIVLGRIEGFWDEHEEVDGGKSKEDQRDALQNFA